MYAFHWQTPKDGLRSNLVRGITLLTEVSMELIFSGHEHKWQEN
jgi:hypothetical protein